jgi:hypothetical protein
MKLALYGHSKVDQIVVRDRLVSRYGFKSADYASFFDGAFADTAADGDLVIGPGTVVEAADADFVDRDVILVSVGVGPPYSGLIAWHIFNRGTIDDLFREINDVLVQIAETTGWASVAMRRGFEHFEKGV